MYDTHEIWQWLAGITMAVGAWVMNRLFKRVDTLEDSHKNHKLHVAETYVSKVEFSDMRGEIRSNFADIKTGMDRIYDKLDHKQDKQ